MSKTFKPNNYIIDESGLCIGLPQACHQRRVFGRPRSGLHRLARLALPIMASTGYMGSLGTKGVRSQLRFWRMLLWSTTARKPWVDGHNFLSPGAYVHVPALPLDDRISHRVYPRDLPGYVASRAVERGGRWWWLMERVGR